MPESLANPAAAVVKVVVSTEDNRLQLADTPDIALRTMHGTELPVVEIDPSRTGQSLLGMGASLEHSTCSNLAKLPAKERERVVESLVSPKKGIGMNLIRLCIGTSDFTGEPYYTYN
ncbi:MAG: hypothetical protein ACOVT5_08830, partial [Armatimonadaceae bacterium]